ncbi:uncharacterized protein LOC100903568 [Galendromus occidentalis]|uniref:Uncharacterized protein LOC100903568 n=1 Tax=Galendromus occidentalis TaxID=34638 RepID=A0AAJ6QVQ0_9ACAR|nr:uncharacterized protein LOC100903568 [Galendromus occidentalis]
MACRHLFFKTCDHLLLVTVVAPLVSMYWCGMFFLVDEYVFPTDYVFSIWFTCVVGFGAVLICHIEHEKLTELAHTNDVVYNPLARLYSILLIIIIVFQWRGFWYILEYYLPSGVLSAAISIAVGFLLLSASGCCKSITGVVPFVLTADDKTNYFVALSKFSHVSQRNKAFRLIDHLYSVFFIHPAVILLWRGLWHIQDHGILVDDHVMSGIVSVSCGSAAVLSFYIAQFPINRCVKTLSKIPRFLVEQTWKLLVVSAAVFYWRGTWVFFEMIFQKHVFTMWFVTIVSAFMLCVLNVWSIATLRGVWVDDPLDSSEDSILFDIHYFQDIASVVKDTKIIPVYNEKYVENIEAHKAKSERKPILDNGNVTPIERSDLTIISIAEWEKMHESDL